MRFALFTFALCCAAAPAIAQPQPLTGGGEVSLRRDGDILSVTVTGPRAGLASLCVAGADRIRILHASAAVGEAVYTNDGDRWTLKSDFEWELRDAPTGGPSAQQRQDYLSRNGWLANADRTGSSPREFQIRLGEGTEYLGVTFLATSDPMGLSYWPPAMANDDCRLIKIAQGHLPQTASFQPETWYRVQARE